MPDVNHHDLVLAEHARHPPDHTLESVLAFTVRVIRTLPRHERAGLVRSFAGAENTRLFHGVLVRVGRVCYPDGTRYKILTDIPTTLAPVWNLEEDVNAAQYFDIGPFLNGAESPPFDPPPPPNSPAPPTPSALDVDLGELLLESVERIVTGMEDVSEALQALTGELRTVREQGVRFRLR